MSSQPHQPQTGCCTVAGRRPTNQDAVVSVVLPDGRELVAVADGMGGHRAGEVASRCAVETVAEALSRGMKLPAAFEAANERVHTMASESVAMDGMGTTLVALLRSGDTYEIANIGDSRAYWITDGVIRQITVDHSVAAEAVLGGDHSGGAALQSKWRHALTRALGTGEKVDVDVFGPFRATERHAVLLCSDGAYRNVSEGRLRSLVTGAADPQDAARAVVEEAHRNGSTDNISAAVVLIGDRPRPGSRREARSSGVVRQGAVTGVSAVRAQFRPMAELALILVLLTIVIALLVRSA